MAYQPWSTNAKPPPRPLDRPVWVDLDRLYGVPPAGPAGAGGPAPHHLISPTGRVPGTLRWWVRAADGRWFGRVTFAVTDTYGAVVVRQVDVLVAADALTPAERPPPA